MSTYYEEEKQWQILDLRLNDAKVWNQLSEPLKTSFPRNRRR